MFRGAFVESFYISVFGVVNMCTVILLDCYYLVISQCSWRRMKQAEELLCNTGVHML